MLAQVRNFFSIISLDVLLLAFSIADPTSLESIRKGVFQFFT